MVLTFIIRLGNTNICYCWCIEIKYKYDVFSVLQWRRINLILSQICFNIFVLCDWSQSSFLTDTVTWSLMYHLSNKEPADGLVVQSGDGEVLVVIFWRQVDLHGIDHRTFISQTHEELNRLTFYHHRVFFLQLKVCFLTIWIRHVRSHWRILCLWIPRTTLSIRGIPEGCRWRIRRYPSIISRGQHEAYGRSLIRADVIWCWVLKASVTTFVLCHFSISIL